MSDKKSFKEIGGKYGFLKTVPTIKAVLLNGSIVSNAWFIGIIKTKNVMRLKVDSYEIFLVWN